MPATAEKVIELPPLENELMPHWMMRPEGSAIHPFAAKLFPGPYANAVEAT